MKEKTGGKEWNAIRISITIRPDVSMRSIRIFGYHDRSKKMIRLEKRFDGISAKIKPDASELQPFRDFQHESSLICFFLPIPLHRSTGHLARVAEFVMEGFFLRISLAGLVRSHSSNCI